MNTKETKKKIIQAGQKAIEELIKVAKEKIVDSDDDVSADRLKNAAATKKLAIMDAFEILTRIQEEEENTVLFEYLETAFLWLDTHDKIANFHLLFLLCSVFCSIICFFIFRWS